MAIKKRFRSAISGRFVSKDEAERKPRTTVAEKITKVLGLKKK